MAVRDSYTILRRVVLALELLTIGMVAGASAYLALTHSPDPFQQVPATVVAALLAGLALLGVGGLVLYRREHSVIVLVAFDAIATVGPAIAALVSVAWREPRSFLISVAVGSVPILAATGIFVIDIDPLPGTGPAGH